MKKKIIFMLLCSCMIITVLQGCGKNTTSKNKAKANTLQTEAIESTEQNTQTQKDRNLAYIAQYNRGCKVIDIGEPVKLKGMQYTVNSVTCTKQKGNWDNINGYEGDEVDQNNRLMDKDSYFVVVNVTAKKLQNNDDTEDFYWNSISLAILEKNLKSLDTGSLVLEDNYSASIVCQSKEREQKKSAYREDFKLGEEKTTDMIYLVRLGKDRIKKDNLYLLNINPQGMGQESESPKDYVEVYLESLEGGLYETDLKK